jgi:hypothetical protein
LSPEQHDQPRLWGNGRIKSPEDFSFSAVFPLFVTLFLEVPSFGKERLLKYFNFLGSANQYGS